MSDSNASTTNMRSFNLLWLGQVVSMFGTGLTGFALSIWVLEKTGSVSDYTLIMVFGAIPGLLVAPIAGALIDRWNRKWVMVLSDSGAALGTIALVGLLWADQLAVWHVYVITAFAATFMSFQQPAFMAVTALLVPKEKLGRAAGMMQFGHSAGRILAPLAAGALLVIIAIEGLIAIDLVTFLFAVGTILMVAIPATPAAPAPVAGAKPPSIGSQGREGLDYILDRPGFVALTLFFAVINLFFGFGFILVTPLVLSFADPAQLGLVLAVSSAGMLVGSLVMTAWGGPQRRMLGILGFTPLFSLGFLVTGFRESIVGIAVGVFLIFFTVPIVNGCAIALWQVKVPPALHGRVFTTQRMISQVTVPISYFLAGVLADRVFEPMMSQGGALSGSAGSILGTGPGRGIGLIYLVMGVLMLVTTGLGVLYPRLRDLEDVIPDALPDAPPPEAAASDAAPSTDSGSDSDGVEGEG